MLKTTYGVNGAFVAPHHLAAQAGRDVLKEGGNAVEAMVAAAATIAVVYPHMNSIGGDGFWLIHEPGKKPIAIDASGFAADLATGDFYSGLTEIPTRGPKAALTTAGTISGWSEALNVASKWGRPLSLQRLLAPAIEHAKNGIVVTESQARLTSQKLSELTPISGFVDAFTIDGESPSVGSLIKQQTLAATLEHLAKNGLEDFYQGEIAEATSRELEMLGSPLRFSDLAKYKAQRVEPLHIRIHNATIFNLPPPTQGLASLMILGIFDKLGVTEGESFAHIHGLIEATKRAFRVRDANVTDPGRVPNHPQDLLMDQHIAALTETVDRNTAMPWPDKAQPGDTIWMGCIDNQGRSVSFIQSIYWEFGSGIVLKDTGINWQNRGISFSLDPNHLQALEPGRKPFHTLNPALAQFSDGRVMCYGTMGGEGQPQTQAAVFSRYGLFGDSLQAAVTAPRWLLGRTWGETSTTLKLENRFNPLLVQQLLNAGHAVEVLAEEFSDSMGHAGALVLNTNGIIEGAADPRSDGCVSTY